MLHIGMGINWIKERFLDGTQHKLVLFSPSSIISQIATWEGVLEMVKEYHGEQIYQKLFPFLSQFPEWNKTYTRDHSIYGKFIPINDLPVVEKYQNEEFMTAQRFQKIENPTIFQARAFLHSQIGCNEYFLGTGKRRRKDMRERK